jgi:hypothetical protein
LEPRRAESRRFAGLYGGAQEGASISATKWKRVLAAAKFKIDDPDGNPIELFEPAR